MTAIAILLLVATPITSARTWSDGKLTSVVRRVDHPYLSDHTKEVIVYEYTVEAAGRFYVAEKPAGVKVGGFGGPKDSIDLDINGPVKFAIENKDLFLLDKSGKENKLHIIKHGIKEP